jgi:hypothetical protein
MKLRYLVCSSIFSAMAGLGLATSAEALIIDFEDTPNLLTGPSLFEDAGAAQEISIGGVTLNGGVVLGFPTNFFAPEFSTAPNVYGTAFHPSGGVVASPTLLPTVSISIDSGLAAQTVEGLLFNGLINLDTFTINAFSGGSVVDSLLFENVPSNLDAGFSVFRLNSGGSAIDLVEISADLGGSLPGEWDFFIDTVAIGVPIEDVLEPDNPTTVPEPSVVLSLCLIAAGSFFCKEKTFNIFMI